ncbi:MAG: HigA family addiction module antidote protein [Sphingomonas sp.]|nr:HigA family addiction module antidote protein [Sphingomonas sp.]
MSKSPIITDGAWSADPADWLENPHAGEMLKLEFLDPLEMSANDLAASIGVDAARIADVIEGRPTIDAELDLRLSRYFGMSEGFFLRLQNEYELLEAKRALNGALDRIVPRAA